MNTFFSLLTIRRLSLGLILVALVALAAASSGATQTAGGAVYLPFATGSMPRFELTPVGGGFNSVTDVTHAGDDRLFIAEQAGVIKILHPDGRINTFLDIRHQVISHRGEYGFFSLAFHPDYNDPTADGYRLFYVAYTTGFDDGETLEVDFIVSRFRTSADPNLADGATETILLREKQSFDVHKGGGMAFDPRDHMLYVGMGDDRLLNVAQSDRTPKGKIIRLEVDRIPPNATGDRSATTIDEIWAFGFRNPWRIDVDWVSDQIFVGEVGDALWEEINIVPMKLQGVNYGWHCMEGPLVIPEANDHPECQNPETFQRAIHEYPHRDGNFRCAVIGGKVYRPDTNPGDNRFIFADMCTREIFSLTPTAGVWQRDLLGVHDGHLISTIGEDRRGRQYIGTIDPSGPIYRLTIP